MKIKKDCDKLSKKIRHDFDKKYNEMMVEEHKEALKKFEKEAEEGKDEQVRTWAFNMLPSLRTHLDHALACQERMGGKGDTAVVVDHDDVKLDRKNESKDHDAKAEAKKPAKDEKSKKDW